MVSVLLVDDTSKTNNISMNNSIPNQSKDSTLVLSLIGILEIDGTSVTWTRMRVINPFIPSPLSHHELYSIYKISNSIKQAKGNS